MRPDIVNLRQFYSSQLGRKVKRRLRRLVRDYWPSGEGTHVVGLGYATPFLPLPRTNPSARVVAMMPMNQGAIYWPVDSENHSTLGDELRPPFMPSSLHRVLVVHAFEHLSAPEEWLAVWWQLLVPGGRLMLMVPNRHGLWSRVGRTPFAHGTPYTLHTLRAMLNAANFTVRDARSALYAPPSEHPFWLRIFHAIEWSGAMLASRMGGVLVIEAEKQIYAGIRPTLLATKPSAQWKPSAVSSSPKEQG